jgi:hypothetical protein
MTGLSLPVALCDVRIQSRGACLFENAILQVPAQHRQLAASWDSMSFFHSTPSSGAVLPVHFFQVSRL